MTSTTATNDVPQSVAPSIAFEIPIKKVRSLFVFCHVIASHLILPSHTHTITINITPLFNTTGTH